MSQFNILVVYPHPADSATDASGTVALHAERGDKVTSVVVSYGVENGTTSSGLSTRSPSRRASETRTWTR